MIFALKIVIFIVASCFMIWGTKSSLKSLRRHGIYRLLAWETILALILLNVNYWFLNPFGFLQIIAWLLLIGSLLVGIPGIVHLQRAGKPDKGREDDSLIGIEKTTQLVTTGIYRFVRHPMYSSLLLLAWGTFFKQQSIPATILVVIATICLINRHHLPDIDGKDGRSRKYAVLRRSVSGL